MTRSIVLIPHVALIAVVALVIAVTAGVGAAQSPSTGPGPTFDPPFDPIVSDDGRLTAYLPVGVPPPDVTISVVRVPTLVPWVAAYELRPLGETFPAPVTVTWQPDPAGLPPATDGDLIWLGMARTDGPVTGPWAWLDDPHVAVVNGSYMVTGQLTRFGTLVVTQLPTLIRGPEAIWGPGYAPGRGVPVDLDLTLVTAAGDRGSATFSGDWRFEGGYPDRISVATTVSEEDRLAAVWRCLRTGATSLTTTFGVREGASGLAPTSQLLDLPPAATALSVTFPVACGAVHLDTNG